MTIEIEHVNCDALIDAASSDTVIIPNPSKVKIIQDKYAQKVAMAAEGVPLGSFQLVRTGADIVEASKVWGWPVVLKARRGAYDGKGNAVIRSEAETDEAIASLGGLVDESRSSLGDDEQFRLYAEQWVPYVRELAIMAVNNANSITTGASSGAGSSAEGTTGHSGSPSSSSSSSSGCISTYPVVVSQHQDSVLREAHVGSPVLSARTTERAQALARQVSEWLGEGVVGVEMFELADGRVLYNECAPRPHNTGHYTIEACGVSQFEQLARVLTRMPAGSTSLRPGVGGAIMFNVLGGMTDQWLLEGAASADAAGLAGALRGLEAEEAGRIIAGGSSGGSTVVKSKPFDGSLRAHWYGKTSLRQGRKMAHVTVTGATFLACLAGAKRAGVPCEGADPGLIGTPGTALPPLADAGTSTSTSIPAVPGSVEHSALTALQGVEPPVVAIIMGSDSDLPHMEPAARLL